MKMQECESAHVAQLLLLRCQVRKGQVALAYMMTEQVLSFASYSVSAGPLLHPASKLTALAMPPGYKTSMPARQAAEPHSCLS